MTKSLNLQEKGSSDIVSRFNKLLTDTVSHMRSRPINTAKEKWEAEKRDLLVRCDKMAIELGPDCIREYLLLAEALMKSGKKEEAVDCLEKYLELSNDPSDLMEAGEMFMNIGLIEKARAAFKKSLKILPNNHDAQRLLNDCE